MKFLLLAAFSVNADVIVSSDRVLAGQEGVLFKRAKIDFSSFDDPV